MDLQAQPVITQKDFPIEIKWVIAKSIIEIVSTLILLLISIQFHLFGSLPPFYLYIFFIFPIHPIGVILSRSHFYFTVGDKFLMIRQGIFTKRERDLPYGVIQNIYIQQGLLERILGLSTLSIENGAQQGLSSRYINSDSIGSTGNKINIPGLSSNNAQRLREILLAKIKQNPTIDRVSGL